MPQNRHSRLRRALHKSNFKITFPMPREKRLQGAKKSPESDGEYEYTSKPHFNKLQSWRSSPWQKCSAGSVLTSVCRAELCLHVAAPEVPHPTPLAPWLDNFPSAKQGWAAPPSISNHLNLGAIILINMNRGTPGWMCNRSVIYNTDGSSAAALC